MRPSVYFVDTWGFIAWFNKHDANHERVGWVFGVDHGYALLTSWPVVLETVGFTTSSRFRREAGEFAAHQVVSRLTSWIEDRLIEVLPIDDASMRAALNLRKKFRDIPDLSLVDCTTVLACKDAGCGWVISGDHHLPTVSAGQLVLCDEGPPSA